LKAFREPARDIPVADCAEVVVAGGGPGGVAAAISAAREGADTLLVERAAVLGGMATSGLMTSFNGFRNEHPPDQLQSAKGIAQEIVLDLALLHGVSGRTSHGDFTRQLHEGEVPYAVGFDPEILKYLLFKMCREAGVRLMLHTQVCESFVEDNTIRGIIVENKSGRQGIEGKIIVDATGDGDVAARAGVPYRQPAKTGEHMMGMSLMYRVANVHPERFDQGKYVGVVVDNTMTGWGPGVGHRDGTDARDLTEAEIEVREKIFDVVDRLHTRPGFEDCYLMQTAETIGVRETRHIEGEYVITEADAVEGRHFDDVVAISSNPVPGYYGKRVFFDHEGFHVPYRSLVPLKIENLILAGRCISAEQVPFQSARSMAPLMAISQASGTAAALCAKHNATPRKLDVSLLQKRLIAQGAELGR